MIPVVMVIALVLALALPATAETRWSQKEFVIGAWSPPPPAFTTDEVYSEIAKADFTLVIGGRDSGAVFPDHSLKVLDLCRKYGLKCVARDGRIDLSPLTPAKKAELDQVIAAYHKHPALYGYYLMDEPNPEQYRQLVPIHQYFREKDPKHAPYINLYPAYGGPHQIGFENYDGYVRDFANLVKPLFISYDHYNFLRQGERPDWFENLEIARRHALRKDIPLWVIVQSLQDATRYRPPTLNQMYWQISSSLAYGAKGIFYFPYWSTGEPNKPEDWHYLGVRFPDATPTEQYKFCCEINPKLKALGKLLMTLTSVSVAHIGHVPRGADAFTPDDLIAKASGDQILIGRLAGARKAQYVMLVNRDWDKPTKAALTLTAGKSVTDAGRMGPGEALSTLEWNAYAKTVSVTLAPGEGRLIAVK